MQRQIKKLNFEGQNIYIGIDVHKKDWKVSIMSAHLEHKAFCQKPDVSVLRNYLHNHFPGASYYSVYEAGFCGFWIHRKLESEGIHNIVVNPADVPSSQKEQVQKTDKRDSRKLARSLRAGELEKIHIPDEKTQEDRQLVRTRSGITKDLRRVKQRVKSFLNFYGITPPECFNAQSSYWSRRYIDWLKSIELTAISSGISLKLLVEEAENLRTLQLLANKHVRELSQSNAYSSDYQLLFQIPGIGLITGMTLLTQLADIKRFKNTDQLAGYIGLVPNCHSSGEDENNLGITFRGLRYLRELLIESSWIAARRDPALHQAYLQYCHRMDSNKAIIRIARKLVNRIYYVLRDKKIYTYATCE